VNHIVHISNTDIASDSRIRKEIIVLRQRGGNKNSVIGLADDGSVGTQVLDGAEYFKLPMMTRVLKSLPRSLRYFLQLIEFTVRVLVVVKNMQQKHTVIHCHDTFALPAGWLIKRIYGGRLVYDAHELESNKNGQNIILSKATLAIERFCWKRIDLLISVSDSILHWYDKNLGPKQSALVMNSPIYDSSKIIKSSCSEENYFVQKYGIPKSSFIFVYLGILAPGRGIESCLEAFKVLDKRAQVVFIGFGRLKSLIEDAAKAHDNIHFHPPVEHCDVVPLVAGADYGLCFIENTSLSDYFCLPNKLFEYSFAGLKILASNFPEIEKAVKRFELGTCCDPTPAEIKAAVSLILESPPTHIARDISELSWERQAQSLIKAYSNMLLRPQANY
jgi:glycosyltransferase involved in cell wall biosynthesis